MRREQLNDVLVRMEESKTPWLRYVVGVLGLGAVFGGFMLSDHLGEPFSEVQDWLLVAKPYGFTKWYDPVVDALLRVLLYVSVAFASVSFMCLVPIHRHWFTELGSRTIAAYLLHRVFLTVYTDVAAKFWDDDDMDVALEITLGVFVLPLIVSQLCLTRLVTKLCTPLLSPARKNRRARPDDFPRAAERVRAGRGRRRPRIRRFCGGRHGRNAFSTGRSRRSATVASRMRSVCNNTDEKSDPSPPSVPKTPSSLARDVSPPLASGGRNLARSATRRSLAARPSFRHGHRARPRARGWVRERSRRPRRYVRVFRF